MTVGMTDSVLIAYGSTWGNSNSKSPMHQGRLPSDGCSLLWLRFAPFDDCPVQLRV